MDKSEQDSLRELKEKGICPNCGSDLQPGKRFPRGDGVFCSLDCVAQYYEAEFIERARRIAAAVRN
jgi:hypothetical protein